jgi:mannobiose 2-epimerase
MKSKNLLLLQVPLIAGIFLSFSLAVDENNTRAKIADEINYSIHHQLLNKWYPAVVDAQHGGFLSNFTYDFQPEEKQEKMIVSQSRQVWTASKAAVYYPESKQYLDIAAHGFYFLRDKMWDHEFGGFHTLTDQKGTVLSGGLEAKTAYGNAFAIYGLAAYFQASGDTAALHLAQKAFHWLEEHSHDPVYSGYFQSLARDGSPLLDRAGLPSTSQIGYKDQNSSIHLLEAFTELYQVWPDPLLGKRLKEMLYLIRDTMVTDKGYLQLFFQPNWNPVSYRDSAEHLIEKHHVLDHVSFGHDVETAYLMLEAAHVLGIEDPKIMEVGKKMVDHSLNFGWDEEVGGFYDGGFYFKGEKELTIVKDTKNWWAQAEGLNTLLIMADYFPEDPMDYFGKFQLQWEYIKEYLIDQEHGEWYAGGLDKEPHLQQARKAHIWKTPYHNFRSLANCVQRLRSTSPSSHL